MRLLTLGLATWRLSHMLVHEAGPGRVFTRLREHTGIEQDYKGNVLSWPDWNPLACVWCTSLYVSMVLLLCPNWFRLGMAAGGVACLTQDCVQKLRRE